MNYRNLWYPAGNGNWHHFVVTEYPLKRGIGSEVRVAYETTNSICQQIPTDVDTFSRALQCAAWNLAPSEARAVQNLRLLPDGTVTGISGQSECSVCRRTHGADIQHAAE